MRKKLAYGVHFQLLTYVILAYCKRNVRHKLCEPDGMNVFAVLVSVSRTYHKQGIFPRTVEELIRNPDEHIQAAKQ